MVLVRCLWRNVWTVSYTHLDVYKRQSGDLPTVRGKQRTVAEISGFIKGYKGHLPLLYRYSPADYYNVSALLDGSVYLVSAAHMNDFWEGKVVDSTNPNIDLVETLKKNQEEIYLKSFSSDRNSSVMWQKYAGNYTGLCVTYNFNNVQNDAILSNLYPCLLYTSRCV